MSNGSNDNDNNDDGDRDGDEEGSLRPWVGKIRSKMNPDSIH